MQEHQLLSNDSMRMQMLDFGAILSPSPVSQMQLACNPKSMFDGIEKSMIESMLKVQGRDK
jgi:hypothetical protein